MYKNRYNVIFAFFLLFIYDYLFWSQTLGLNVLLFTCLAVPLLVIGNKLSLVYRNTQVTIMGTLLLAVLVFIYNSGTAKVAYVISFFLMVGFIHQPSLRTVYNSVLTSLYSLLTFYKNYAEEYRRYKREHQRLNRSLNLIGLTVIPMIVVTAFYWIFKFANPVFDHLSSRIWDALWIYIDGFFAAFSFLHFIFLVMGLSVCSLVVFNSRYRELVVNESRFSDVYRRVKNKPEGGRKFGAIYKEFVSEFRIAVLTISLVNLLLLVVNVIDMQWVWFNFDYSQVNNLSQFVHEGTYLLILSILISMGIMLYFFRGNLNLLRKNKSLKVLAYVWIFQNAVLVLSVAIRNYHYIHQHGLAYKRIGVVLFLILVLYGLFTLVVKIHSLKSSFYLFKVNSWAIYGALVFTSLINWDILIARYNIDHAKNATIDYSFLINLSDKTLYLINENRHLFKGEGTIDGDHWDYASFLNKRVHDFIRDHPDKDIQSFTVADQHSYEELIKAENKTNVETLSNK
jgi:hypothetical protein